MDDDKLMKQWKKKYYSWKRFNESNTNQGWSEYKKEQDKLRRNIRKARRLFEKNIAKIQVKIKDHFSNM